MKTTKCTASAVSHPTHCSPLWDAQRSLEPLQDNDGLQSGNAALRAPAMLQVKHGHASTSAVGVLLLIDIKNYTSWTEALLASPHQSPWSNTYKEFCLAALAVMDGFHYFSHPHKTVVLLANHIYGFHKCLHLISLRLETCSTAVKQILRQQQRTSIKKDLFFFPLKGIIHSCSSRERHFKGIILQTVTIFISAVWKSCHTQISKIPLKATQLWNFPHFSYVKQKHYPHKKQPEEKVDW